MKNSGKKSHFSGFSLKLMLSGAAILAPAMAVAQETADAGIGADEIVVTATRSNTALSKVPISVSAFSQKQMDQQGVRQFSDLTRLTPGLALNQTGTGRTDVSIRGVTSTAGAATTGIYIDDVPIQVRQIGYAAGNVFPAIFDLERVEVLRGPQGTLFGSGSQGGTVRFIQPKPSLTDYTGYARLEGSLTPKGDGSYEGGVAFGGPIVEDKLGFRVSAFHRRDGGWIDKVPGTFVLNDNTGGSYGDALTFTPTGKGVENYNFVKTQAYRAALTLAPTENFTLMPSIYYQQINKGSAHNNFWLSASDISDNKFVIPDFSPAAPQAGAFAEMTLPDTEHGRQRLLVAALEARYDLDGVSLYSTTSHLEQRKRQYTDYTPGYDALYFGAQVAPLGAKGVSRYVDRQKSFTQEVRLQSNDDDARIKWVLGGFFTRSNQVSDQYIEHNRFKYAPTVFGTDPSQPIYQRDANGNVVNDGAGNPIILVPANSPFGFDERYGVGTSNFLNIWGAPLIGESGNYLAIANSREKQLAFFGQVDFKLTEQLTLVAGARWSRNTLRYSLDSSGAENNLNAPFGAPCPAAAADANGYCDYDNPPAVFAPEYPFGTVRTAEKAFTPKIGLNFQIDDRNLVYASVAKGYRPGGAQIPLPSACYPELIQFGYVDGSGAPYTPPTYTSDSVWSYEIGSKNNRLFGGAVNFAGSAYMIKWDKIQTNIGLPNCAYSLVDNLGSATIKGFDMSVDVMPAEGLRLNATVGYNHTSLDEALIGGTNVILPKGSAVTNAGSPWRVALTGHYETPLSDSLSGYLHVDYTYSSAMPRTGNRNPGSFNYNRFLLPDAASSQVNLRLGGLVGGADISLFVNNLLDAHPRIGLATSKRYMWSQTTLRPRTFGITAAYRY